MAKIYDWRTLNLQSLDLILCAGTSKMSRRIQTFQRLTGASKEFAKFSHVAGVFGCDGFYVEESTTLNKWAGKSGVQRNPTREWLENYNGEVYVRKLDFHRSPEYQTLDYNFWFQHCNDKYENGIPGALELFLCGLRLHRFIRWFNAEYTPKFTSQPHCTELQALRMLVHEILEDGVVTNRMPPWVWCEKIDKYLRCNISDLIRIK